MGLLDDAIREHLELKRRHGASEEEIAQEEAEALGPARRDFPVPAAAEPAEPEAEAEAVEEAADIPEEPAPPEEPVSRDPLAKETLAPTVVDEPEPEVEPEPEPEPDTEEHEGAASDEDVLEETPDFLQDAPEHDRLWFEQKPPRDFDFD